MSDHYNILVCLLVFPKKKLGGFCLLFHRIIPYVQRNGTFYRGGKDTTKKLTYIENKTPKIKKKKKLKKKKLTKIKKKIQYLL